MVHAALLVACGAPSPRTGPGDGEAPVREHPAAAAPETARSDGRAPPSVEGHDLALPSDSGRAPAAAPGLDGSSWLSWLEAEDEAGRAFMVARLGPDGVDAPTEIVAGPHLLANWADVPKVHVLPSGRRVAAWLVRPYELRVAFERKEGGFSAPVVPHRGSAREFGFPAFFDASGPGEDDEAVGLAWIQDGSVRATLVRPDGADPPVVLDDRTCECCRVAALRMADTVFVAYRDRSPDEVRDISLVRLAPTVPFGVRPPTTPAPVGWRIAGCPVNGPALAATGSALALARFDGARGGRVEVLFGEAGARSFGHPRTVDAGHSLGRAALAVGDPDEVVVAWLSAVPAEPGRARILVRRVHRTRGLGPVRQVATTTAGRDAGFPVLARTGADFVVVWTEPDAEGRLHLAARRFPASSLPAPA
ncbi:MAG: hypothetical protein D6705_00930 [Deltaproteobacteria bacterium]|nr:MAG: hypothetical protein D6705_00930 [Deltaproteobacteria bacterium]